MSFQVEVAGRFAREALDGGEGEVCAVFRRSLYLRCAGERYACIGDATLGNGPLNARVPDLVMPRLGERVRVSLATAQTWRPPARVPGLLQLDYLTEAARDRVPKEGLGCLVLGSHNALSGHAQPELDAL